MWQRMKSAIRRSGERTRAYASLASMDDHMLRDIGVHRGDVRARIVAHGQVF